MTRDPIRRRFGHGAARLPIGSSTRGPSLAHLAQRKVAHERLFAAIPAGVCLSMGAFLFFATQLDPADPNRVTPRRLAEQLADQSQKIPPLEIEFWEEAPEAHASVPEPTLIASAESAAQTADTAAQPTQAVPLVQPDHAPTFDPKRLALRAPSTTPAPTDLLRTPAVPAMRGAQAARPGSPIARAAQPRINLPTRGQAAPTSVLAAKAAPTPLIGNARPGTGGGGGTSAVPNPNWSANAEQRAFLTAQAKGASGSNDSPAAAPRVRLSPVSAAADTRAHSNAIRDALSTGGWQQVPLDALPDCSPAGRQDELKRSILRAAPAGRSCTDQNGSFRFVETNNLGAFLMWSRTHPDAFARAGRDRDACVVLERALHCLAKSSNQEL